LLVVDASVGLKWVLSEPDGHLAEALLRLEPSLVVPDFWLNEATNVLWLQVRRGILAAEEAREALGMLQAQLEPTPTTTMRLHDMALDIGIALNHPPYDTLYLAFALAVGASAVIVADAPFARAVRSRPDREFATMVIRLDEWATSKGLAT
jgi:predicted nucleic acid-binding protein